MWFSLTWVGHGIIRFATKAAICSDLVRIFAAGVSPCAIVAVPPALVAVPPVPLPDFSRSREPPRVDSSPASGFP
jgi:hypothetical protein